MKASCLAIAALLASGAVLAEPPAASTTPAPRRPRTLYIAPGNPATVGQGGAVTGVVPGRAVPAPTGAMSTFGGLLGTGNVQPTGAVRSAPSERP